MKSGKLRINLGKLWEAERVRWFGEKCKFAWPWKLPHISYGYQSRFYGKFGEISNYGGGDGREVGLGRVMDLWDKDKFDEWRKRETEGYDEREMRIVTQNFVKFSKII